MLIRIALPVFLLAGCAGPPEGPQPAWPDHALVELRQVAASAQAEGLPAETAAISALDLYRDRLTLDSSAAEQLDLAADELFARLAHTFATGAIDPRAADPAWRLPRAPAPDVEALRARALDYGVRRVLSELLPSSADYAALRSELTRVNAEADGMIDSQGRSRDERIASLRVSMERWRWLPRDMPDERIEARIAQFEVLLFREGRMIERHAAIVGARNTQTPAFDAEIVAVTLNPAWTVPRSILLNELMPRFRRDPAAASRLGYEVIDAQGRIYDPTEVDWSGRFPYTLRRRPGLGNPLGRLKFEMTNPFDIYLHDTSNPELFARANRALSHGCVRVADSHRLALQLLEPPWESVTLDAAIADGATRLLRLGEPISFYAIYMTATVSNDGGVSFADDVYGRDLVISTMLDAQVPSVAAPERSQTLIAGCS